MSDLLDGIQRDLRKRLDELRPLVNEYEQLRQAMAALDGVPAEQEPAAATPRATSASRRNRAPAGRNRDRVLAAVRDNPGASASQLADASGVQRNVVYGVLRRLATDGLVEKRDDPETGTGYALPSTEAGNESATGPASEDGELATDAGTPDSDAPD